MILRPATAADAGAVADIDFAAKRAALPFIRWAHSPEEVRAWLADVMIAEGKLVLAEDGGVALGYMGLDEDWVDLLYIHPDHWRRGVGARLIGHAKAQSPTLLRLWCFQRNDAARAFYARQGFVADTFTDGADNEEKEPDVLFVWRG